MKKMLLGAAALTLMFTACKKSEESSTPSNTWKVGSTTYNAISVNAVGSILTAATTEGGGNSVAVAFNGSTLPTTGGSFSIKQNATGSNEVTVIATESSTAGTYQVKSGTLNVTVDNGKVTVDMPSTNASYIGATTKADAQVSLHIAQP